MRVYTPNDDLICFSNQFSKQKNIVRTCCLALFASSPLCGFDWLSARRCCCCWRPNPLVTLGFSRSRLWFRLFWLGCWWPLWFRYLAQAALAVFPEAVVVVFLLSSSHPSPGLEAADAALDPWWWVMLIFFCWDERRESDDGDGALLFSDPPAVPGIPRLPLLSTGDGEYLALLSGFLSPAFFFETARMLENCKEMTPKITITIKTELLSLLHYFPSMQSACK